MLQPIITDIRREVWNAIIASPKFWGLAALALVLTMGLGSWVGWSDVVFAPFLIVVFYVVSVYNKARTSFWKQFADVNGWRYTHHSDPSQESGIMFRQGKGRSISHCIEGNAEDRKFRIFNYEFSIGSGRNKHTYYYTVFAFLFLGRFPHVYLNRTQNAYGVSVGEHISLPAEFEKKFVLSAPREYEIEALEMFTPAVLAKLLDNDFPHDIEFVNQEMLIFSAGRVQNFGQLEKEFKRALELEDILDEKLDRFKFQPIGDRPHIL
ncbi:MAG: hypothetical protein AAB581_00015 [Patescibacteria group bacterium]